MRKEVKPAVKCEKCGQITEYAEIQNFCDFCGKLLPENMYPLHFTYWKNRDDETESVDLCSWKCVRDFLIKNQKKILRCRFMDLPIPIFKDNVDTKQHCDSGANFYKDFLVIPGDSNEQTSTETDRGASQ